MQNISDLKRPGRGYLAAVLGSLVGATAGLAGGTAAIIGTCHGGLECVGHAVIVGVTSAYAASVAGCFAALRLRKVDRAGRTTALLPALLVAAFALSFGFVFAGLGMFPAAGSIAGAAVGARCLAIRTHRTNTDTKGDNA